MYRFYCQVLYFRTSAINNPISFSIAFFALNLLLTLLSSPLNSETLIKAKTAS
jgi:hypothetical protein